MRIFPAIDLSGGKVVRLFQGDYDKKETYSDNPLEVAENFIQSGAENLHLIDLDGAKDGRLSNFESIERIARRGGLFIEVGGGIRDEERIAKYLGLGVGRVILGTVVVQNFEFAVRMANKYPGRVAAGVDAKEGFVAINGWTEKTKLDSFEFCRRLRDSGIDTVIYTDISKDGTLTGTNLEAYESLSKLSGLNIIASGGISFEDEIRKLKAMKIYGAILGKALYEGKLDLKTAVKISKGEL